MRIEPFVMERWQSTWEHQVSYNLSESGVHPLTIRELLEMPGGSGGLDPGRLLDIRLGYAQGNGREDLRRRIALLYPDAGPDNVLVTHGGAEANFLTTLRLIEEGDEVVMMLPNYMQTHGLVRGWGARVRPWHLKPGDRWDPDMEELEAAVNEKTRLIILTNPNNPTGRVFDAEVLDRVAEIAEGVGAWILSDEIYRGAELDRGETPSMWGRTDRLVVTSGLSKAYGLPGLRIGWAASPDPEMISELWSYHDYSSICPSPATEALAAFAMEPERRENILERTRDVLRTNLPLLLEWVGSQEGLFEYIRPEAGAILWVRYALEVGSGELAERVRSEQDTLIVPGDQFGMDRYLRLGYGPPHDYLMEGLARLKHVMETYRGPVGD